MGWEGAGRVRLRWDGLGSVGKGEVGGVGKGWVRLVVHRQILSLIT